MAHRSRLLAESSSSDESDAGQANQPQKKKAPQKKRDRRKKKRSGGSGSDSSSKEEEESRPDSEKSKPSLPTKSKSSAKSDPPAKTDEDYKSAARAVTRCVDMWCKTSKVIETVLYIIDEEAAKRGDLEEEDIDRETRHQALKDIGPDTIDRHKRAYQLLIRIAPRLKGLVNDASKLDELRRVVQVMNKTISMTRADDTARLKDRIGNYTAPEPLKASLTPPICTGAGSRSNMGVNHPVLARYLCPVRSLAEYIEDETVGRQNLMNGKLKMTAKVFPAFLWEGDPPGQDYDPENMHQGMFRGYLVERVLRHIFTGPSTSFGADSLSTRPCNADLHNMTKVEAAHIAYACVLARFGISTKNRWSQKDGVFNYKTFYYLILQAIEKCEDTAWKIALLENFNVVLFKDPKGRLEKTMGGSEDTDNDNGGDDSDDDDFLTTMQAQAAARATATGAAVAANDGQQVPSARNATPAPGPQTIAVPAEKDMISNIRATTPVALTPPPSSPVQGPSCIPLTPSPVTPIRPQATSTIAPQATPARLSELSELEDNDDGDESPIKRTNLQRTSKKRKITAISGGEDTVDQGEVPKTRKKASRKGKEKAVTIVVSDDENADPGQGSKGKKKARSSKKSKK